MSVIKRIVHDVKTRKEAKEIPESKELLEDFKSSTVQNPLPVAPLGASPGSSMAGLPSQVSASNRPVKFRLTASGNLQTNAIGVLAGVISTNPAVTSYTEFTAVSGLFAEIKLVKASLTLANYNPDFDSAVGGVESGPLPIAFIGDSYLGTPSSVAGVWGTTGCKIFGLSAKRPMTITHSVTSRSYIQIASTTYAPGPYAGMSGSFFYYQSGLSNSNTYCAWFLEVEVMLKQRI